MTAIDATTDAERADFYQMQYVETREILGETEVEVQRLHDELGDVDAERRRLAEALADETAQRLELAGRLVESENGRIAALAEIERLQKRAA